MALVQAKFTLTLILACTDDDGAIISRSKNFELIGAGADAAAIAADVRATALLFIADYADVTGATIVGVRVTEQLDEDSAGLNGDNLYKELLVNLATNVAGTKSATLAISAPAIAVLESSGKAADVASTELQALLDHFKAAGDVRISDGDIVRTTDPILSSRVRSVSSGKSY